MGKPPPFPDASIGGSAKQNEDLFDQVFSEKNINMVLKTAISSGVKFVPGVGALLSGLVSALWPNKDKNKTLVWEDIEKKVETVASGLINKNNSLEMRSRTEGIYNVMVLYLNQPAGTFKKGGRFDIMLASLEENQPYYFNDSSPWLNLAYFAFMGTLHLTVLREQHLFYKDIWGEDDQEASRHQRDLEDTVEKYLVARNAIVRRCLEWHSGEIREEVHKKDSGYFNTNDLNIIDPVRNINENFHWSENNDFVGKKKYMCRIKQLRDWVNTGYRSQIEALLSPTFAWPLYHPNPLAALSNNESGANDPYGVRQGQIGQLEPGSFTIQRLMMDYPGWIGDGVRQELAYDNKSYSSHEQLFKQHGPITKMVIYAGARIDGIEVFYGDQPGALIGRKGGSQQEALNLKPGEFITGLWANDHGDSGSIFSLKLQVTREDGHVVQTAQYGQADAWKYSFDGHEGGLQGGSTKRLLWLSGWDYDDWRSGWVMRLLPAFGHYQAWGPLK